MTGDGGKASGWYKAQLGPGGFSVIADFEEDGPLGKEIGHEIFSWDPKKNAYAIVIVEISREPRSARQQEKAITW